MNSHSEIIKPASPLKSVIAVVIDVTRLYSNPTYMRAYHSRLDNS